MRYRILLPANYSVTTRRFPVLYLLHGLYGDFENWETRTNLTQYAEQLKIIIVMPDAGSSWYVNSATNPADRFEDYIVRDLIPEIERSWRTIRSPHRRAIAGLSMGGYGAMKFGLKYPEMFAVAASVGGAFNAPLDLEVKREDFREGLVGAFGPATSSTRRDNDVFQLATIAVPNEAPYLYLDCGASDKDFHDVNRKFSAVLHDRKFSYEYHELPGAHTWDYWDRRIPVVLQVVSRIIGKD